MNCHGSALQDSILKLFRKPYILKKRQHIKKDTRAKVQLPNLDNFWQN